MLDSGLHEAQSVARQQLYIDRPVVDMPLLSLFSGSGGLDLGFERVGFRPLLALDSSKTAVETYNWNRRRSGHSPAQVADLSEEDPVQIARRWEEHVGCRVTPGGIIGGPPCQAFSASNVHQLEDDPRSKLPLAYAGILKYFNQRYGLDFFLFENVAGLGHRPHSTSLSLFLEAFADAGFDITLLTLDAADYGVPQHRKRLFILGFNSTRYPGLVYGHPQKSHLVTTVEDAIGHLREREPVRYRRGHCDPRQHGLHPNHWCMNPRSSRFTDGSLTPGETRSRPFRRLRWDKRSWTVAYGHREVHVHPDGHRRLSVYEAMLLQSFPPAYELRGTLSQQISLVSDAVPPLLAQALATSIATALQVSAVLPEPNKHHRTTGQLVQEGLRGVQMVAPKSTSA